MPNDVSKMPKPPTVLGRVPGTDLEVQSSERYVYVNDAGILAGHNRLTKSQALAMIALLAEAVERIAE